MQHLKNPVQTFELKSTITEIQDSLDGLTRKFSTKAVNNLVKTIRINFLRTVETNQNFIATRQMLSQKRSVSHLRKFLLSHYMAIKLMGQKYQWPHITKNIDYEKLVQESQKHIKSDKTSSNNKP